jgi:hypothetical protein
MTPVRVSVANMWTYGVSNSGGTDRQPPSRLGDKRNAGHIHGGLTVEIAGRSIPHLGFFGPDDVCLNTWVVELCNVVNALVAAPGEYTFDEGEQGQPAFQFIRVGDEIVFSIVESALGGGRADTEWQGVRCPYEEFRAEVLRFLDELRDDLRQQVPENWGRWWPSDAVVKSRRSE